MRELKVGVLLEMRARRRKWEIGKVVYGELEFVGVF